MPRIPRIIIPDVPHHITQRGNNGQQIFLDDLDRRDYVALLRRQCDSNGLRIIGYCMMTNHVHLIGLPEREESVIDTLRNAHTQYSQRFNRKYGKFGTSLA